MKGGGQNPAFAPRLPLIIAGDIESNPGPPTCNWCGKPPASRGTPFTCAAPNCNTICHAKPSCSFIKKRTTNPIWLCSAHGGRDPKDPNQQEPLQRTTCSYCGGPANANSLVCAADKCDIVVHVGEECCKIKRRTANPVWLCPTHSDRPPLHLQPQLKIQEDAFKKCDNCGSPPMRSSTPLECRFPDCGTICCRKEACSGISRGRKYPIWKCSKHRTGSKTPAQSLTCESCNEKIGYKSTPLICPDCEDTSKKACHPTVGCSDIRQHNNTTIWKCRTHREANQHTLPTCDTCNNTDGLSRHLKCSECNNICHKRMACSNIPARTKHPNWKCSIHAHQADEAPTADEDAPTPADAPESHATPLPSPKKHKCAKPRCKPPIASHRIPIFCASCKSPFHVKCSGLNRDNLKLYRAGSITWTCEPCLEKDEPSDSATIHGGDEQEEKDGKGEAGATKKSLRILQWNADGLSSKLHELRLKADELDLDVILIQESKLEAQHSTPKIIGYSSIRSDRKKRAGGGLMSYIRTSLTHEKRKDECKDATETSTFAVKTSRNRWADITNLYCPPASSPGFDTLRLATEIVPVTNNSIICGDFNAHSLLWDNNEDTRGEEVEDWIIDKGLTVLNDGTPTRIDRREGPEPTAPDVTLCGSYWSNKCTWQVIDGIGSSDHQPILIEVMGEVKHNPVICGQAKWKTKDVDWQAWSDEVEATIHDPEPPDNIEARVRRFNKILIDAAYKHLGKVKPGKHTKCWMTPTVRGAIRKRNFLRRNVRTRRREWLESCKEAQDEIRKAKEESWKELLEETITDADDIKMWHLIKSLNGTPDANSPNEAMVHKGKKITTDKGKANAFVNHYAKVSDLTFSKEDRNLNRNLRKRIDRSRTQDGQITDFTMHELTKAIKKMKKKGAAGPDDIPPVFLKNLGSDALNELLDIFNLSLHSAACPQIWRNAIIIPILKAGKPASDLASFRPISLTSCIVKALERMIAERLYYLAETNVWFSKLQAGFRKGRGCEDQILKIAQAIEDGFQQKKRSVLVLLDFSKAYDTVWRQKLLMSMADKGVPMPYVIWLFGFLQNRQARVRFNGTLGRSRSLHQGLPQGSVLAPILFLFYINNLAEILPQDTLNALYADDVTILATAKKKEDAVAAAQATVDIVSRWSKEWKIDLNTTKSEACFFSLDRHESKFSPIITINNTPIRHEPEPRLLGVHLDRELTFTPHTNIVTKKAKSKMRMLAALGNTEWGWRKQDLRRVYLAHIRSVLDYAGSAWQPWIKESNIERLETTQNTAIRIITRQAKTSPVESLRLEANLPSYSSVIKATCMRAREKALRLPEDHPRRICLSQPTINRLKSRSNCRTKSEQLLKDLPVEAQLRKPIIYHSTPPWMHGVGDTIICPVLPGCSGKDDDQAQKVQAAMDRINAINANITIYTDGSASGGTLEGGAAAVITTGNPRHPTVSETLTKRGAIYTSSYEEEVRAMETAVGWLEESRPASALIITDSQSLCEALQGYEPELDNLRLKIRNLSFPLTIQWVPGHSDIPGNELADKAAKDATELEEQAAPVTYGSICAQIRKITKDPPPTHERTKEVYSALSHRKEKNIASRSDQTLLAKIRTGHTTLFRAYEARVNGEDGSTTKCPLCGEMPHDLQHWISKCAGTLEKRRDLFGPEDMDKLEVLSKFPSETLALAKSTLLGARE